MAHQKWHELGHTRYTVFSIPEEYIDITMMM